MKFLRLCALFAAMAVAACALNADVAAPPPPLIVKLEAAAAQSNSNAAAAAVAEKSLTLEQYVALSAADRAALVAAAYPAFFPHMSPLSSSTSSTTSVSEEEAEALLSLLAAKYGATGPWQWIKCKVCEKSIGFFVGKVTKFGCGKVTLFSAAICEIAGLGPADPLSTMCVAAVVTACPIVAKQIANKVTNPSKICKAIKWCE